ncbi:hypothetical protein GCM10010222_17460 [Streptomyces tanashiensis]|nr:hypothetical protein GCM10010222_17460 [Streptomyces tanashiensis]
MLSGARETGRRARQRVEQADVRAGGEEDRRRTLRAGGRGCNSCSCLASLGPPVSCESLGVGLLGPDVGQGRGDAFDLAGPLLVSGGVAVAPLGSAAFSADEMRTPSPPGRVGRTCSYRGGPVWSRVLETGRSDARIVVTSE